LDNRVVRKLESLSVLLAGRLETKDPRLETWFTRSLQIFDLELCKTRSKISCSKPARLGTVWGSSTRRQLRRDGPQGGCMEHQAPQGSSVSTTISQSSVKAHPREGRNFWVLTVYGISGLVLFGILAYYFSDFVAR
jgi:hypothetical protein